ncbi:MAG: hypothetical protein N3G19_02050 [Candidatus Pacearchaeota archaeon]|nr:hypothetical protein [Candidatus Pacearchaeota archaeon]
MIEILKRNKKKEIEELLEKNFNIKISVPYYLIRQSKDKIRIFTGNLSSNDIIILSKLLSVETIGLYFAFSKEQEFRLSFDASILYGKNSKKIIELNNEEAKSWLKGENIENKTGKKGYFLIKYNDNILGCGKATQEKILNFVPKERRVKS